MKTFLTTLILTLALTACIPENPEAQVDPQRIPPIEEGAPSENSKSNNVLYVNEEYQFSMEVPEDWEHCEHGKFCNSFSIDVGQFYLEILPRRNTLGMSAVEFAKRSLEMNRKYSANLKDGYSEEKESTFAGEPSYEFIAAQGFEERGLSGTPDGNIKDDPEHIEQAGQGRLLNGPHKIIYFDHNGVMYRIVMPLNNEVAQKILDSFKFLE